MSPSYIHNSPGASDWWVAFNNGNPEAIKQVFQLFYKELCYYIEGIVGFPEAAEEMAGDAFVKLWAQSRKTPFSGLDSARAFLWVVSKNAAFNYLRDQKKVRRRKQEFEWTNTAAPIDPGIDGELWPYYIAQLHEALKELPEQQKEVIRLTQQGLTLAEIADSMSLAPQTVRNHYSRALSFLKRRLSELGAGLVVTDLVLQTWLK